jgi:hypothetical protein
MTASGHVDRYVNYYIANGFGDPVDKGHQFSGVLQNVDLEHMPDVSHFNIDKDGAVQGMVMEHMSDVSHFNIDKDGAVQGMVMRDIQAALSAGPPRDTAACNGSGGHRTCATSTKNGLVTEGTAWPESKYNWPK